MLDWDMITPAADPEQQLVVSTTEPGTASDQASPSSRPGRRTLSA